MATRQREVDKPRGGPRTPEGKAVSRANALKHGLSATRLLPETFDSDVLSRYYEALRGEWDPDTPTQELLVRDLARHQAALERIEQMELAVLRRGALKSLDLGIRLGSDDEFSDAILAAAGTSDAIERISRYRRQHERALLRDLAALRESKRLVLPRPTKANPSPRLAFSSEEQCEAHLIRVVESEGFHCPRCGGRNAKWLESRRVWQCRQCRRQQGIRAGTVLEGSRVGLLPWFRAIELVVNKPEVTVAELAAATNVRRKGTIRKAMDAPDASRRLAGLDAVFRVGGPVRAEIGARQRRFLQNELPANDRDARDKTGSNS